MVVPCKPCKMQKIKGPRNIRLNRTRRNKSDDDDDDVNDDGDGMETAKKNKYLVGISLRAQLRRARARSFKIPDFTIRERVEPGTPPSSTHVHTYMWLKWVQFNLYSIWIYTCTVKVKEDWKKKHMLFVWPCTLHSAHRRTGTQAHRHTSSARFIAAAAAAAVAAAAAYTFARVRNIRINRTVAVAAVDGCIKHDLRVAAFCFLLL